MYKNELMYYALGGASDNHRVVRYDRLDSKDYTIEMEKRLVTDLLEVNPGIKRIFVVTNTYSLLRDYRAACKRNCYEEWVAFKDLLERTGREIPIAELKKSLLID